MTLVPKDDYETLADMGERYGKLYSLETTLEEKCIYDFDREAAMDAVYRIMADAVGDEYTAYFDEEELKAWTSYTAVSYTHLDVYKRQGLEDANIHINKGDFVFLVGPSGAGKSTFIKLILKEINADSGSIVVDGREVTSLSNREIPDLRRKIGIVFQDFRLLPKKTVYENVAFAMEILHKSKRQIAKKVPQVLSLVGISDKADKYPDELSAGEQQRVAIARAIINNPTVLIADEPTGNLDPDTAAEIMDLLNQINITGTTIVMVTHAKDIAVSYTHLLSKSGFILTVQVRKDGIISSEIIEPEFFWPKTPNNVIYHRIDESYQLAKGRK